MWSDVLEACADREDLDRRVVACARFASKPTRTQASARAAQDKASVKAVKRAAPRTVSGRASPLTPLSDRRRGLARVQLLTEAFFYISGRDGPREDRANGVVSTNGQGRHGAQGPCVDSSASVDFGPLAARVEHWSALDVMVYHGSQASR